MIPRASITAWRRTAPWPETTQVEQDLVLSRALVAMFGQPAVAKEAVFRGGTALHKLVFDTPGRYSEDIDLVQRDPGPIGPLVAAIREALDPWLGEPKWKQGRGRFSLYYRFATTFVPVVQVRLKVEINTREHFSVLGLERRPYTVTNPWFSGRAEVVTYTLAELLGTKLRALYQRKRGRDLFDLWLALTDSIVDCDQVLRCFAEYMTSGGGTATRAQFEENMAAKLRDAVFVADTGPLLRPGLEYEVDAAWSLVHERLVGRMRGEPWKGNPATSLPGPGAG
jgi:predicted nucleotidyltransferase component of viral defense system